MRIEQDVDAIPLIIGVTSHRDLREAELDGLREQVGRLFARLHSDYPDLRLTVLSPLAEGGDQLVAQEGLRHGARLMVPLPLPVEMYLRDFKGDTQRQRFLDLLAQGDALPLPLPENVPPQDLCQPGPLRDMQYARCGLYVADHCHMLVALWDGRPSHRLGGTAQVVAYYLGEAMPGARDARTRIRQVLANDDDSLVFHIPTGRRQHATDDAITGEEPVWLASWGTCPGQGRMPRGFRTIFTRLQSFSRDLQKYPDPAPPPVARAWIVQDLFQHADRLALHFQRRMMFAMRATYVMAACMGATLLVYQYVPVPQSALWLFLLIFAAGVVLTVIARRREWHRKYIDYRALAEGLRVQSFWRRAGIATTGDQQFAHDNFLQKQDVDLGWIRNVMRHASLQVSCPAGAAEVEEICEEWVGRAEGNGQLAWYADKAVEHDRQQRHTRVLGTLCLWVGIAICLLLAVFYTQLSAPTRDALALSMGTLSVVAAVRAAYAYRKADKELVKQYRFMHRIYRNARAALDASGSWQQKQEILRALGEAALAEHAEWALMHRERPLEHGRL
ncbi:MAG: hypothetical protein ACOH1R_03845 [Luteimonas sp.]